MGIFNSKRRTGESRRPTHKAEVTDADRAVLSLKTQRRKLSAERQRLEGQVTRGLAEAKKYIREQRRERALLALRRNKLYEQNLDKIDAYLLNVEQVLSDIETAQRNNRLYAALKEGNTALTQLQKQVTLEDVEKLNDEAAEAAEYQERLRELLGETLTAEQDAAALKELEKIQAEQEAAEAASLPKVPRAEIKDEQLGEELPAVPQHQLSGTRLEPQAVDTERRRQAVAA